MAPPDPLICSTNEDPNSELTASTRSRSTRKVKPDEAPFEFKATTSLDVMENPAWNMKVNRLKGKSKKPKKAQVQGPAISPSKSSNSENIL